MVLFLIVCIQGWLPTFEPTLGTSKGGTRIRVHSTGSPTSLSDYFLQLGFNGETLAADHIGAINDTMVESQFIMPNVPSEMGTKGVVELSFSRSGDPYVGIGSFIFYGKVWYAFLFSFCIKETVKTLVRKPTYIVLNQRTVSIDV